MTKRAKKLTPMQLSRQALREGTKEQITTQVTFGMAKVEGIDVEKRIIPYTISTPALDRHGDKLFPLGAQFENYIKNPVVLFAHNKRALPIGRGLNPTKDATKVTLDKEFATKEQNPFADYVFKMIVAGFMNACSVGFWPLDWGWADERDSERGSWDIDYRMWDLLESSPCPVPANPEALVGAKEAGIDMAPLVRFLEDALDGLPQKELIKVSQGLLERSWEKAADHPLYFVVRAAVSDVLGKEESTPAPIIPEPKEPTKTTEPTPEQSTQTKSEDAPQIVFVSAPVAVPITFSE